MKRGRVALFISSLVVISAVAAVIFIVGAGVSSAVSESDTPTIGGHAAPEVAFERLAENSDLVVLGVITSKEASLVPCCGRFAERLSSSMPAPVRRVETLQVNIQESFKGSRSSSLTVKVQRPGGNVIRSGDDELSLLEFDVGQTYVLFLVEREGHSLIQGVSRGRWTVNEGTFEQTGTGVTLDETTMRESLASDSQ